MDEIRKIIAEAFHEHRRHMLRMTVPFVKEIEETHKFKWVRYMGAAWQCLRDSELDEPYYFADKLIKELQEQNLLKGTDDETKS